jgi:hypothetical protein
MRFMIRLHTIATTGSVRGIRVGFRLQTLHLASCRKGTYLQQILEAPVLKRLQTKQFREEE